MERNIQRTGWSTCWRCWRWAWRAWRRRAMPNSLAGQVERAVPGHRRAGGGRELVPDAAGRPRAAGEARTRRTGQAHSGSGAVRSAGRGSLPGATLARAVRAVLRARLSRCCCSCCRRRRLSPVALAVAAARRCPTSSSPSPALALFGLFALSCSCSAGSPPPLPGWKITGCCGPARAICCWAPSCAWWWRWAWPASGAGFRRRTSTSRASCAACSGWSRSKR